MKKLLAIITLVAMLFTLAPTAFAQDAHYKFDIQAEFKMEMVQGLDYLSEMAKETGIDVNRIVNELLKAKYTMAVKGDVSDDFLTGCIYAESYANTPITFSEDLKISIDSKFRVWADYDFSSVEAFKCKIVVVNPLNGKYTYVDLNSEELNANEEFVIYRDEFVNTLQKLEIRKGTSEISSIVKSVCEGKAKIEKAQDGYTMSFNNNSLVEAGFELFEKIMATDYVKGLFELAEEEMPQLNSEELDEIESLVKSLNIFAEDAYTLKVKCDAFGKVSEIEESSHIQCNLYSVAEAMGADMELEPEYITKENTNLDIKLISTTKFNNTPGLVEMPVLNEENSIDYIDEFFEAYVLPDETYTYSPQRFSNSIVGANVDSEIYVGAEFFIDDSRYDSDNLTGSVEIDENKNVTMIISNDYMAPVKIEGVIGKDTYKINGVEEKGVAFVMQNLQRLYETEAREMVCVNVTVLNKVLECALRSTTTTYADYSGVNYEKPVISVALTRPNKGYVAALD